ncbi:hypothetical protein BpHYR1_044012 [Brachionus plicatilis]|uniref:Uncharacterized protein n=1 Tax=Brachionus plicatilis TaxID=10195 RepID=A0A3M7PU95_BRAPC|nr:hypothetical protein BpHYR1_044012 [Brachionus plicatilis]
MNHPDPFVQNFELEDCLIWLNLPGMVLNESADVLIVRIIGIGWIFFLILSKPRIFSIQLSRA